jgi:hypothetical protein
MRQRANKRATLIAAGAFDWVDWENWNWEIRFTDGTMIVGGWMFD